MAPLYAITYIYNTPDPAFIIKVHNDQVNGNLMMRSLFFLVCNRHGCMGDIFAQYSTLFQQQGIIHKGFFFFLSFLEPCLCNYSNKTALPFHYNVHRHNLLLMCYERRSREVDLCVADRVSCYCGTFLFRCKLRSLHPKVWILPESNARFGTFQNLFCCPDNSLVRLLTDKYYNSKVLKTKSVRNDVMNAFPSWDPGKREKGK